MIAEEGFSIVAVETVLSDRHDYLVFINQSQALHPLSLEHAYSEVTQTYPSGV